MLPNDADLIVVGGGLAGLSAAAYAARAGRRVTVLEAASELGGRARTEDRDGFRFNYGPHALYRAGVGMAVLRELGVTVTGRIPPAVGSLALAGGRAQRLPVDLGSALFSGLLGWRGKGELALLFRRLPTLDPAPLIQTSLADWTTTAVRDEGVRGLARALFRLSTYAADERISAGEAIAQLQRAVTKGVLYLDGGWQTIVDRLADVVRAAGARISTAVHVAEVEMEGGTARGVRLGDGTRLTAPRVLLAVPPAAARKLLPRDPMLAAWSEAAIPIRAACLDLALFRLPIPRHRFALGIDAPTYFSVHSATAKLAPEGGALVHVARYLVGDERVERSELEAIADLLQPGWREVVTHARFLPRLPVSDWLPTSTSRGLAGRPGPVVLTAPGVFVAGDWVGSEGMLADGSLASGRRATRLALSIESDTTLAAA